jgi:predicted nucleic acid-binding Zn ribbon protein
MRIPYIRCVICFNSFPADSEHKTCSLECHRIWFRQQRTINPPIKGLINDAAAAAKL